MVQNTPMNNFRSVVVTILLVVMAVEMVLPIFSHHWFNAAGWRAYTLLELGRPTRTTSQRLLEPDQHELGAATLAADTVARPRFLLLIDSNADSSIFLGTIFVWVENGVRFDLFDPRHWVIHLTTPLHQSIHLPPEVIPPRSAQLVMDS
jgi:hypothetical protein